MFNPTKTKKPMNNKIKELNSAIEEVAKQDKKTIQSMAEVEAKMQVKEDMDKALSMSALAAKVATYAEAFSKTTVNLMRDTSMGRDLMKASKTNPVHGIAFVSKTINKYDFSDDPIIEELQLEADQKQRDLDEVKQKIKSREKELASITQPTKQKIGDKVYTIKPRKPKIQTSVSRTWKK